MGGVRGKGGMQVLSEAWGLAEERVKQLRTVLLEAEV
jgi:hypothetical protein